MESDTVSMKLRWLLIAAGVVWAVQALYFYLVLSGLGFPDGSLTELARIRKRLYPVLIATCTVAALASWALCLKPSRFGSARAQKAALFMLPSASLLIWAVDRYLAMAFDDGGGG